VHQNKKKYALALMLKPKMNVLMYWKTLPKFQADWCSPGAALGRQRKLNETQFRSFATNHCAYLSLKMGKVTWLKVNHFLSRKIRN
jgi:hypothetical protein